MEDATLTTNELEGIHNLIEALFARLRLAEARVEVLSHGLERIKALNPSEIPPAYWQTVASATLARAESPELEDGGGLQES